MIPRALAPELQNLLARYPIVTLTGPRQSGKTTLCRETLPDFPYVNFEEPDVREFANEDPRAFLARYPDGAILDEIQRSPDLPSYLQALVDDDDRCGLFVLTGSQQLLLNARITQSLAGRTALLRLLPLSIDEARHVRDRSMDEWIYSGFYPRIYDRDLSPTRMLMDYFETYVERDVRQLMEIRNLTTFRTFVKLCAGRVGQLLNINSLGDGAGVSHTTAREWLSVLEASYVIDRLPPLHANISKRLMKSPKLYFYDVGLACYLLGIENARQIFSHPLRGSLFENLVVMEVMKWYLNRGRPAQLHFFRDSSGFEIDLILGTDNRMTAIEIKSGATLSSSFFDGLKRFRKLELSRNLDSVLVYGGDEDQSRHGTWVTSPNRLCGKLSELDGIDGVD